MTKLEFKELFNLLFFEAQGTVLVDGASQGFKEPVYLPAHEGRPAQVVFAHGFLQSALHEAAHWCHAGERRRALVDYGYWYVGDERSQEEQEAFERVELIPQAYELLLSEACGVAFKVSLDNFNASVQLDRDAFAAKVETTARQRQRSGLPSRLFGLLQGIAEH